MAYRTTRHVRHGGKLHKPGAAIGKLTDGQAERLLKIGAIVGDAGKAETPPAPEGGEDSSGTGGAEGKTATKGGKGKTGGKAGGAAA